MTLKLHNSERPLQQTAVRTKSPEIIILCGCYAKIYWLLIKVTCEKKHLGRLATQIVTNCPHNLQKNFNSIDTMKSLNQHLGQYQITLTNFSK